jgi:hypothetical protein
LPVPVQLACVTSKGAESHTSLNISTVSHVVGANVTGSDVLDGFKGIVVLTDAANGNTEAGVEVTVFNQDVGTVGLHGNRVISVGDIPAAKGDVIRVDYISAIGIIFLGQYHTVRIRES